MPRTRPRIAPALFLLALGSALPACDLTPTDETSPIAGEWIAVDYVVVNAADPGQTVRLIPDRGWFEFFVFSPGGYHEVSEWVPDGGGWSSEVGRWNVSGSRLTVSYEGSDEVSEWHWESLPEGRVALTLDAPEGYDFDGDDVPEPTHERFELVDAGYNPDSELLATWTAQSFTFTADDGSDTVDLTEQGGAFRITFFTTATYQYSETVPTADGTETRDGAGDFAAVQGFIWLIEQDDGALGRYSFDDHTLVIRFHDAAWDFDGDGTEEPAALELRLTRQ